MTAIAILFLNLGNDRTTNKLTWFEKFLVVAEDVYFVGDQNYIIDNCSDV